MFGPIAPPPIVLNMGEKQEHTASHILAKSKFNSLLRTALFKRWKARLTGHAQHLLTVPDASGGCSLAAYHYAGQRPVPISEIKGSENRNHEFDMEFHPLTAHLEQRWVGVASAMMRGITMPPVELLEVDGLYYVRDGHHRISVARELGQVEIDAEVIVMRRVCEEEPAA